MSKCAFSAQALSALIPTVRALEGRVELQLDYVATSGAAGATSPYGAEDLVGDRYQLCAKEQGSTAAWLTFLSCQNQDLQHIPDNADACAKLARLEPAPLRACAEGSRGSELLSASVRRSAKRNVSGTPTIFINGASYTGGRTKGFLGRALCAALPEPRPPVCNALPEAVAVPVTIVADQSCTSEACGYANFKRYLDFTLEGAQILEVDARSATGSKLLASIGNPPTPLALFASEVEKERDAFGRLQAAGMAPLPGGAGYAMVIRSDVAEKRAP